MPKQSYLGNKGGSLTQKITYNELIDTIYRYIWGVNKIPPNPPNTLYFCCQQPKAHFMGLVFFLMGNYIFESFTKSMWVESGTLDPNRMTE